MLLIPFGLGLAAWIAPVRDDKAVVSAVSASRRTFENFLQLGFAVMAFTPLAVLAAWRTWVHARRYVQSKGKGWQGVAEAGAAGFLMALWGLSWGIVNRPADALPYVVAYCGGAALAGAVIGLLLRATGVLVLKRA